MDGGYEYECNELDYRQDTHDLHHIRILRSVLQCVGEPIRAHACGCIVVTLCSRLPIWCKSNMWRCKALHLQRTLHFASDVICNPPRRRTNREEKRQRLITRAWAHLRSVFISHTRKGRRYVMLATRVYMWRCKYRYDPLCMHIRFHFRFSPSSQQCKRVRSR